MPTDNVYQINRKHRLNAHYFDHIDTEEQAY